GGEDPALGLDQGVGWCRRGGPRDRQVDGGRGDRREQRPEQEQVQGGPAALGAVDEREDDRGGDEGDRQDQRAAGLAVHGRDATGGGGAGIVRAGGSSPGWGRHASSSRSVNTSSMSWMNVLAGSP